MPEIPQKIDSRYQKRLVRPAAFQAGRFEFPLNQRTYLMGILNVTPDSFSDGGQFLTMDQAIRHAEKLLQSGADILDIGGESTRPGFSPVSAEEELLRVIPIIKKLTLMFDCPISIDTYKPSVAAAALDAGACIVNDINGFQQYSELATITGQYRAGAVIMHNARLYRSENAHSDIISDVRAFLQESCKIAFDAGLKPDQLLLDPGIGFGVSPEESIAMIARLDELKDLELPILIGPSRKRFIGHLLGSSAGRLNGTIAAVVAGIIKGADFVRVHDIQEIAEAAKIADAIIKCSISAREENINEKI
jgi:dihydropteroate synthase